VTMLLWSQEENDTAPWKLMVDMRMQELFGEKRESNLCVYLHCQIC
jgi:hypothetical protein